MTPLNPLFWIQSHNFGDRLNPLLYKAITGEEPVFSKKDGKVLAIGSIMHEAQPLDTVWGTGCMSPNLPHKFADSTKFLAVRGPLTAQFIKDKLDIYPTIYGDPALLLPLYFPPAETKDYQIGVVLHYADNEKYWMSSDTVTTIGSTDSPPLRIIQKITSCDMIVSSSLHGIVVAETYGIPAVWVEFGDSVAGKGFKFRDYYASTNRDIEPLDAHAGLDLRKAEKIASEWSMPEFDLQKLLKVCPFGS